VHFRQSFFNAGTIFLYLQALYFSNQNPVKMKLTDFTTLNKEGREYAIFEYAVPVSTTFRNRCICILYQLSYFFVEKIIDVAENNLLEINCFDSSSEKLDDYLEDIILPAL
jgi:hypothetical protein